jgi:hypothetical protein
MIFFLNDKLIYFGWCFRLLVMEFLLSPSTMRLSFDD